MKLECDRRTRIEIDSDRNINEGVGKLDYTAKWHCSAAAVETKCGAEGCCRCFRQLRSAGWTSLESSGEGMRGKR